MFITDDAFINAYNLKKLHIDKCPNLTIKISDNLKKLKKLYWNCYNDYTKLSEDIICKLINNKIDGIFPQMGIYNYADIDKFIDNIGECVHKYIEIYIKKILPKCKFK